MFVVVQDSYANTLEENLDWLRYKNEDRHGRASSYACLSAVLRAFSGYIDEDRHGQASSYACLSAVLRVFFLV
ncbi:unnamed protein product [Dovyalis caffra]|uniref:Uncharacterized protein n=1 Tax=Dovyalis caffra TaxID=77055 RepID=A0AAV1S9Y0_9ROSI|nr:unnamed protein product [Dovyalis caffra]